MFDLTLGGWSAKTNENSLNRNDTKRLHSLERMCGFSSHFCYTCSMNVSILHFLLSIFSFLESISYINSSISGQSCEVALLVIF